jgi:hypothetical protein
VKCGRIGRKTEENQVLFIEYNMMLDIIRH